MKGVKFMKNCRIEITKEEYEKYKEPVEGRGKWFVSKIGERNYMGYGVYSERVINVEGKYWIDYYIGNSCD